ncbi:MAG: hypothetical protein KA116_02610 [Proteobacteria bacterium]|nr:hypothetical protein [Pseudomonadota bacterium]
MLWILVFLLSFNSFSDETAKPCVPILEKLYDSIPVAQRVSRDRALVEGFHASSTIGLKELDPAFSKNTNRFGPGAYFYLDLSQAEAHARSIESGHMKYDKTPRPAVIYKTRIDTKFAFDSEATYSLNQFKPLIDELRLLTKKEINLPETFTGLRLYELMSHAFTGGLDLQRGVRGVDTPKTKANALLRKHGFTCIFGKIPDPNTGLWNPAVINLSPTQVN